MTNHEFFVQRLEAEVPAFGKVIRAMPEGKLAYKPHEKSTSAGDLAWQLAEEQRSMCDLLDSGEIRWDVKPHPASVKEIAAAWDSATEKLRKKLAALDEAKCARKATFYMGGHAVWTDTVGAMLWGLLFDMVHHRGQLSTYLRPMGGKVPSIYGPSADESGE